MIGSVFLMHHAVNAGDGSEIAGRVQRTRLSRRRRTKRHAAFDAEGFSSVAAQGQRVGRILLTKSDLIRELPQGDFRPKSALLVHVVEIADVDVEGHGHS